MSVGGASWDTATSFDPTAYTSDPTPAAPLGVGDIGRPYYSAWWKFTAAETLLVDLDTNLTTGAGGYPDTQLIVYTGASFDTSTQVAFGDDTDTATTSEVSFVASAGETYYIRVGLFDASASDEQYVLHGTAAPPGGYSEWRTDTYPVEQLVTDVTSENAGAATWGWTSSSGDEGNAASEAATAWNLGGTIEGPGNYESTGFGVIALPGTAYGMRWRVAWLTVARATTVYTGTGTLTYDPFADPNVAAVEWDDGGVLPASYRGEVGPDGAHGWTFAYGRDMPVKYVSDAGTYYQPAPETASAMNGRSTVATAGYTSGGTPIFVPLEMDGAPGSRFAVSLVDPWTATGTVAPFDTVTDDAAFYIKVRVYASYQPRYRLIYRAGASHAPPLRQYPRSDGLATSSARRMWPPSRSYQRGIRRAGGYL